MNDRTRQKILPVLRLNSSTIEDNTNLMDKNLLPHITKFSHLSLISHLQNTSVFVTCQLYYTTEKKPTWKHMLFPL